MKESTLKQIFQQKFDADSWQNMLIDFLGNEKLDLRQTPEKLENTPQNTDGYFLGKKILEDNLELGLFRYKISKGSVAIKKVGLRQLVHTFSKWMFDAVLAVFDDGKNWRVSFISDIKGSETAPKRYTFVFGDAHSSYHTAVQRFSILKGGEKTLENIQTAFEVEKLSKTFFDTYKQHYEKFCNYLLSSASYKAMFKPDNDYKDIRDFCKKMLGRIVFLYFIQKKGWLGATATDYKDGDPDFLKNLFDKILDKDIFYYNYLQPLFFEALNKIRENDDFKLADGETVKIPFLNGGLFERDFVENHFENRIINFDKKLFAELFDFFSQYNFTIDEDNPNDHTIAVDPNMLGQIFEGLLEDNKDKGAYYTPKEIVHYMCQESLKEFLSTHLSVIQNDKLDALIKNSDTNGFSDEELKEIDLQIDKVKICDPAIGSGAFPMGLLHEIFNLKSVIHEQLGYKVLSPAKIKQNIIQNSIYGVDIEQGAVDIARLRFWLSLVIDEDTPKPLPNLDYKIMQGNSLIEQFGGVDLSDLMYDKQNTDNTFQQKELFETSTQGLLSFKEKNELHKLQSLYFDFENAKNKLGFANKNQVKQKIDSIIEEKLIAKFEKEESEIWKKITEIQNNIATNNRLMASTSVPAQKRSCEKANERQTKNLVTETKKHTALSDNLALLKEMQQNSNTTKPFFLWHTWFKDIFDTGGFDVVIGNPPYVQLQNNGGELANLYAGCGYKTFARTGDIYCLFYERGWQLLKPQGKLCYITSNKWMRAGYGENTRKFFAENTNPKLLVDLGAGVFENATVDTNILMFENNKNRQKTLACTVKNNGTKELGVFVRQNATECSFGTDSWVILSPIEQSIKRKIEAVGTPLRDWDINIYRGVLTGYNEAFIIDGATKNRLIAEDPKSAEIIRPILRGKDIKRYGYDFADRWLINTHNGVRSEGIPPVNINDYPAIKRHLDGYWKQIEKRDDQGVTPYNLRNCAYMNDFFKQKIVYPETTQGAYFAFDSEGVFIDKTCFMLISKNAKYLQATLSSKLFEFAYKKIFSSIELGQNGYQYNKHALIELLVLQPNIKIEKDIERLLENKEYDKIDSYIFDLYQLTEEEIKFISSFNKP